MRKLNSAVERFALRHPNFGISNLMLYIVIGNAAAFFLLRMTRGLAIQFLWFDWARFSTGSSGGW